MTNAHILNGAIRANRELATLNGYCSLLPNNTILLNTIILKEARVSSEIENIITTQDELYRALMVENQTIEPSTKEVLNYRSALLNATIERCRVELPKTTYSKELIELLFTQPYTKIEHVVASGIAERRMASKYLQQLETIGVLKSLKMWKHTIYINHHLMDVLGPERVRRAVASKIKSMQEKYH